MRPCHVAFLPLCLCAQQACTMSQVDADAEVSLQGRLELESGSPISQQRVALVKETDLGEVLGGVLLGPVTVLACLGEEPPAICQDARMASASLVVLRLGYARAQVEASVDGLSWISLGSAEGHALVPLPQGTPLR